ncbi:MAG TPA: 2-phospho-L-lactate guanylyltransferase [Acidimicrobiales bacterium]|nr:2-phospho-L-lactate guanylyltransferase [Acidimicrobiales bacterium]
MTVAVIVPVKAFGQAKQRLSAVLSIEERAVLARKMAQRVLAAAQPLSVFVVCDDTEVATWAQSLGANVIDTPGLGLNGAVTSAYRAVGQEGFERAIVAHGDLPHATNLGWLADVEGIVLVPDRRHDGTNVISLPTGCNFEFAYGPGSLGRHQQSAIATGLPWRVIEDARLGWDVDVPADMTGDRF